MKIIAKIGFLCIVLILIGSLFITSCGGGGGLFGSCDCDKAKEEIRNDLGTPEEVNSYNSDDYHSETYWYWSKGISYTFTWGSVVDGCCQVSTYTFAPI